MFQVFANKHWTVERGRTQLLLVVRRTGEPYIRLADVSTSFAELEDVLSGYNRKYFPLLIDMRSAPQRNDPEFEKVASGQPIALARDFAKVAVVVRTASGLLQVARHIRANGIKMEPFIDENEALRYLLSHQRA